VRTALSTLSYPPTVVRVSGKSIHQEVKTCKKKSGDNA
jgi:hypothetical protein